MGIENVLPAPDDKFKRPKRCPTCGSPSPDRHPAMQFEGEVQPCPDVWHKEPLKSVMFNRSEMNTGQMTLELRIQPMIRSMVQKMLLNEEDVKQVLERAIEEALISFNWRDQLQEEIRNTAKKEVTTMVSTVLSSMLWDHEFNRDFRKAVVKSLKKLAEE